MQTLVCTQCTAYELAVRTLGCSFGFTIALTGIRGTMLAVGTDTGFTGNWLAPVKTLVAPEIAACELAMGTLGCALGLTFVFAGIFL